jgi:hypothetical protein
MNGVSETIWTVVIGVIMLAVLYMLVRPGSPAGKAIKDVSGALEALIATATNNFGGNNQ